MRLRHRLLDLVLFFVLALVSPVLYLAARYRWKLRLARRLQDAAGFTIVWNHYYEPVFTALDILAPPDEVRHLPGLDLNVEVQLATLEQFKFANELSTLNGSAVGGVVYRYSNQNSMFGEGDADALYCFIRVLKPNCLIEIGCGQSSLVAQLAFRKNSEEDSQYSPRHICFEPFHNGWLRDLGPEFRKERIETVDLDIFRKLQPNDFVFIDSSHVVRSRGDVEHEFLRILPVLPIGVYVHIHDIFTPRDYTRSFMHEDRRFWTEQYILEAFLTLNPNYEIVLALNYMHKRRESKLYEAFPVLADMPDREPGSFWIRRTS